MKRLMMALLCCCLISPKAMAQLEESHCELLLNSPAIRSELELTEEQAEGMVRTYRLFHRAYIAKIFSSDNYYTRQEEDELRDAYRANLRSLVSETLLPFQEERLRQLALWSAGYSKDASRKRRGSLAILYLPTVKSALEISESDLKALELHANDLQGEFNKELEVLREKYRAKLNDSLTPTQRGKLKTLIGDPCPDILPVVPF